MSIPNFQQVIVEGADAATFLQGQITANVKNLTATYLPSAIANLKGRIQFGIWIKKKADDAFAIVISADCMDAFNAHLKKFGVFSKFTISKPQEIYPCVGTVDDDTLPTFSTMKDRYDVWAWMAQSIATGNYWITAATQEMFQPQEMRLHQRQGVDYNKGCYIGQEVIARLYFKATPKAFLHRIKATGATPEPGERLDNIRVVNAISADNSVSGKSQFEALVVARPEQLTDSEVEDLTILALPPKLQANVGRES